MRDRFPCFLQRPIPDTYFEASPAPITVVAWFWLTLIAIVLYGFAFLRGSFPRWLGYLFIAVPAVLGVAARALWTDFFLAFPPGVVYLLTLAGRIVIWRSLRSTRRGSGQVN